MRGECAWAAHSSLGLSGVVDLAVVVDLVLRACFFLSPNRHKPVSPHLARTNLIDIAPHPVFPRLNGTDERVLGLMEMLRCVLILGRVAAADVSALQAKPQMNPGISHLQTLFTAVFFRVGNPDLVEMRTLGRHSDSPLCGWVTCERGQRFNLIGVT
jgi:hypothetical protein